MFFHQRFTSLCIILLALMISLPAILYTTVSNYMNAALVSKEKTYGAFTDIFYEEVAPTEDDLLWERDISEQLSGFQYSEAGILLCIDRLVMENGASIVLGYADSVARDLGRVRLLNGHFPTEVNEIALTKSALDEFKIKDEGLELGSQVDIYDKEYIICGIIADFGRLWIRGQTQIENKLMPPQIILSEQAIIVLLKEANTFSPWRMTLFVRDEESQMLDIKPGDRFFHNTNIRMIDEDRTYSVPDIYSLVLIGAIFVVELLFLGLYIKERASTHRVFRLLGMPYKRNQVLRIYELLVVLLLATLLSVPLTLLLSWSAFNLISKLGSFNYLYKPEFRTMFIWLSKSAGAGLVAVLLATLFNIKRKQKKEKHTGKSKGIRSYQGTLRLAFWDIALSPGSFISIVAICMLCAGFFTMNAEYNAKYQSKSPLANFQYNLYLPMNYDYELMVDGTKMGNSQYADDTTIYQVAEQLDDPVIFFDDQYGFGATQDFVDQMAAIPGMDHVHAYRVINNVVVGVNGDPDLWSDSLDGLQDGRIESLGGDGLFYSPLDAKSYGVPEITLPTQMAGYPEDQLLSFSPFVSEGRIDIEAIRRGEEIILIVPDYELIVKESENGTMIMLNTASEQSANRLRYEDYQVGDTIDLYGIFSNEHIWGQVSRDQLNSDMSVFHRKVKIGAIIRKGIGEFDEAYGPPRNLRIAMLNESFLALNLPSKYVRVRGYISQGADGALVDESLQALAAENPVMPLKNLRQQMSDYHSYQIFLTFFLTLLNFMLFFISMTILVSIFSGKLTAGRQDYILLRLNGLSLNRFASLWALESLIALLVGASLFVCGVLTVAQIKLTKSENTLLPFSIADMYELQGVKWLYPWMLAGLFLVLLIVISVRQLRVFGLNPNRK
jgi:hypothetical protein